MLVYKDLLNKEQSIYKCDRCKKEVFGKNKASLLVSILGSSPKKKWDLCSTCYGALCRGIKKGDKKTSQKAEKKKLLQFDTNMNFIKQWDSLTEAAEHLNMNRSHISACCYNKIKSARGYIWRYGVIEGELDKGGK